MTTYIILAIFLVVVIIMIAIAVTGSKRDKKKRNLSNLERTQSLEKSDSDLDNFLIQLGLLMQWISLNSNKVKIGKSKYTLSEINDKAISIFKNITQEEILKNIYKVEHNKNFLKPIIIKLNKTQPVDWEKKQFFEFNVITAKLEVFEQEKKESIIDLKKKLNFN